MSANAAKRRAVFLDRDGVINRPLVRNGRPHPPRCLSEFEILPGVPEACRLLKELGYLLVVATNQPDVGRGTLSREAVDSIHESMVKELPINHVMTCFHAGAAYGEPCGCRKPRPGMLLGAAAEFGIDLGRSYIIGDRWRDIDCGAASGCKTIFVEWDYEETLRQLPDYRVCSLFEAAKLIETLHL
jgi:D-glycero-D-manno-heptose 1,7-bisphosphate phosphatase